MTDLQLFTEFSSPFRIKKVVKDFIVALKEKATKQDLLKQRQFGSAKGFFVMADDFDEPLEDFKDYM